MTDFQAKFDEELWDVFHSRQRLARGESQAGVHPVAAHGEPVELLMQYVGDLADIEAQGFETVSTQGVSLARGRIGLEDLERVASHPSVLALELGVPPEEASDLRPPVSASDAAEHMRARGTSDTDGVWWPGSDGTLAGSTGASAAGRPVVIGIIDTGIDITHPAFLTAEGDTRIRRVWDMHLYPQGLEEGGPSADLLPGEDRESYGVEYTDTTIEAHLDPESADAVRHRDCSGHGTGVASAALAIAPGADLVVVSLKGGLPAFEDAVTYIERVATHVLDGRPVVINYSLGHSGAGDGLSLREAWLHNHYANANPDPHLGETNEPTGRVFVTSAGNSGRTVHPKDNGGRKGRGHAVVTIPESGSITVQVDLYDMRGAGARHRVTNSRTGCERKRNLSRDLCLWLWYAPPGYEPSTFLPVPPLEGVDEEVECTLHSPYLLWRSVIPVDEPEVTTPSAGSDSKGAWFGDGLQCWAGHRREIRPRPDGAWRWRNCLKMEFLARPDRESHLVERGDRVSGWDTYELEISGPVGLEMQLFCEQAKSHGIAVGEDEVLDGVQVTSLSTLEDPSGPDIIVVAAYNHHTGGRSEDSSSRGPLLDYGGTDPIASKPDVSAPGQGVALARGDHEGPLPGVGEWMERNGTSVAAPLVAGVVALMLEARPPLTPQEVHGLLTSTVKEEPPHESLPYSRFGAGRVDAKKAQQAAQAHEDAVAP